MEHGGERGAANRLFPDAPQPFIDLSTGINPGFYSLPTLPPDLFAALPQRGAERRLLVAAAEAYGAPSPANVTAAPGTQALLPLIMRLAPPGRALVLAPTYAEHARVAAAAGFEVQATSDPEALAGADLAILVNPNNPDGRILSRPWLIDLAARLARRGGWLVIDEAFMDVGPPATSLAGDVDTGNLVVLRSFGKFYGLAGLRLGFAIAGAPTAERLAAELGPWAVSGPALAIGALALADRAWAAATREGLAAASARLNDLLENAGLEIKGGTDLFRLVDLAKAAQLHDHLGRAGILVRRFADRPRALRFGLPGAEPQWERLATALRAFSSACDNSAP